jgi:phosphoribosylformylglycinamidine cyclo-ligase
VLPKGTAVSIDLARVPVLPVFKWLASAGGVSDPEMLRTFNCGIGMIAVLDANSADAAIEQFANHGETVIPLGGVVAGGDAPAVNFRGHLDLSS